jgi:DNA segregation ATPase FtsK/SpoIIIE, S-DNA-T family
MNSAELIGGVAAQYLRQHLMSHGAGEGGDGTARFILDCLSADQTAASARAVLADLELANEVEIKLPAHFMEGYQLPAMVLTDRRATYFRNAPCEKGALLIANVGDDEQQSLKELVPIGAPELLSQPEIWISIASEGLPLTEEHRKWWTKAISGLRDLRMLSLERLSEYVLRVRDCVLNEGQPIIFALGAALPALHMPRNSSYFNSLSDKTRNHASRWKSLYEAADRKFACYLQKLTPTQIALTESDLQTTFERVKESIPESTHDVVQAFIHAPSGWNHSAAALAECEWEWIAPLFDGFKRERFNLGKATLDFYDEREPELLSSDERTYLEQLIKRKASGAYLEEDLEFFNSHRNELKEDRKLKSAWDKFVFGTPLESEDFVSNIVLCCERLFSREGSCAGRKLKIRCDRATKKDLRELNVSAGLYFAHRYRGLKALFGRRVSWDVGPLFEFADLVESWRAAGKKLNDSKARAALQLKFLLELEIELDAGGSQKYSTQMLWKFNPSTVASEFADDWSRLAEHPLVRSTAHREPLSSKGQFQSVDLSDVKTFVPAYGKDRGSFVGVYNRKNDIAVIWRENVRLAHEQKLVSDGVAGELRVRFDAFAESYASAITGLAEVGLNHPDLMGQLHAYTDLLDSVCRLAKGDRSRDLLLRPLLQIGAVEVLGGQPTIIVAPWHPLRMAAMVKKAQVGAELLKRLLTAGEIDFGDARLFFNDTKQELLHPFYPEAVLGWQGDSPALLSSTDVVGDYTLHESPVTTNEGSDDTNENPTEAAKLLVDLVRRYLALQPHESANLSVVLYNCDSARLPQAVVDKIGAMYSDEDDIRCQVILRHRDGKRLRALYEKIVEAADADADSFNASEATRDFMARLRIGIMADQAPAPSMKDGLPTDIAFSQDVIARHARIEWYYENATPVDFEKWIPARWSRRRASAIDDMKSVVYLCCPVQSVEGWTFLTAITSFIKGDWDGNESRRLLPSRQLDFRDNATARIFEETHNLANWVVNYDELLDRRQLLNQNVRVIRYKQTETQGRNLIVSSKAPLGLLRSMVLSRLKALNLELDELSYQGLADKFIDDAKDISGDIVLRASKRGRNASELMGVVLSRFLVHRELGLDGYYGWYFLDDYAEWLGQREEQIADLMALSPEHTSEGRLRLAVVIAEAKYIDASGLSVKRRESQKQLRDSLKRIGDALFGNPERLDRELWLSRLSDLILDGVRFPASSGIDMGRWRRAIREGNCEVRLRGYSHVFVSGPSDAGDLSDFASVSGVDSAYQEVFSRAQVRELVLRYFRDDDPMDVRKQSTDEENRAVWDKRLYRRLSGNTVGGVELQTAQAEHQTGSGRKKEAARPRTQDQTKTASAASTTDAPPVAETHLDAQSNSVTTVPDSASTTEAKSGSLDSEVGVVSPAESAGWSSALIQPLVDSWKGDEADSSDDQAWLKQIESRLRGALQQFQLQAKLVRSALTPNSALLKFAGSDNLTIDQVLKRRSEFLTTHALNIISVSPEPGVVSIAVERPHRQVVQLPEVWRRWRPTAEGGNQEVVIGVREADGELLLLSPGKLHAPHTLIAGSTGSGKSILMQNIILSVAATNTPIEARITVIDPKQGVDYLQFDRLPHLDGGIIDNQEEALDKLRSLVSEMDSRYIRFKGARANNLEAYNRSVGVDERVPVMWIVHDEFAEWMMVEDYKDDVTALVGRLGVKARAAGLYLVFAAQRPDVNVMPMQLRANLGNRLILRVDSEGTSDIALGERGAERLLGRGHLLAKLEGSPLCYAQVPFVREDFMTSLVQAILK